MRLFKDEVYEQLDDISQLIEPFQWQLNEEIGQMPEEIIIDADMLNLNSKLKYENVIINISYIVEKEAKKLGLNEVVNNINDSAFFNTFFKVEFDAETTYNAKIRQFSSEIKIIKKKVAYDDKDIEHEIINKIKRICDAFNYNAPNSARANEIADLFGANSAINLKKGRHKIQALVEKLIELFKDRTLNIRNVELFSKFVDWIILYIRDGNLPALSNITKIKIMTRSKLPIYSIVEAK